MFHIVVTQYKEWIRSPLHSLWIVLGIFIYQFSTADLLYNASFTHWSLGVFEPFIAVCNQIILQLVFPIFFLILLSDFPGKYCKFHFEIIRIGRERFLFSQIIFLFLCVISFVGAVFLITTLPAVPHLCFTSKWSAVVTDFKNAYPEYSANPGTLLIQENIFFQGKPVSVMIFSTCMLFLHLLTIGMVLMASFCVGKPTIGVVIVYGIEIVGTAICYFDTFIKWIFPTAHSMFNIRYLKYFSGAEVDSVFSFIYFTTIIALLTGVCFERIRTVNLDFIRKE